MGWVKDTALTLKAAFGERRYIILFVVGHIAGFAVSVIASLRGTGMTWIPPLPYWALYLAVFLIWSLLIVGGYATKLRKAGEGNPNQAETLELRRREVEAQEAHTAAIKEQTEQRQYENDPLRQAMKEAQRKAFLGEPSAPTANLSLMWHESWLLLKIQNHGIDAVFDVQIDLTRADVETRSQGEFQAVWRDDKYVRTRRIVEGASGYVRICQMTINGLAQRLSFSHWMGDVLATADSMFPYIGGSGMAPHSHHVGITVAATPRPQQGPKRIELELKGFDVRVISGSVQVT